MKKILIVDDDRAVVDLLSKALAAEDRLIRHAYDGEAASSWISKDTFDLIICDLMLPKGHGLQLIKLIRDNPETVHTKILLITVKSFRLDAEKALAAGADLVLTKPFDLADLLLEVHQLLS